MKALVEATSALEEALRNKESAVAAANRLVQRQIEVTEQMEVELSCLADCLFEWAYNLTTGEDLNVAIDRANRAKMLADPEPFRLANRLFAHELAAHERIFNEARIEKRKQEKILAFKKTFNAVVASGKLLSDNKRPTDEDVELRRNSTPGFSEAHVKLDNALREYHFKFGKHPSPPSFQEWSKIDYYLIDENIA